MKNNFIIIIFLKKPRGEHARFIKRMEKNKLY